MRLKGDQMRHKLADHLQRIQSLIDENKQITLSIVPKQTKELPAYKVAK